MNKRLIFANVLDKVGATGALLGLRRIAQPRWLPVVTFHRVLDPTRYSPYLFDDGVVDAAPDEFERHVRTISRHFTPVGVDEVVAAMDGVPLPKNPILVTFDDGYKDNLEVALPILKRHNVKAVFFIATHYLSQRRMFWWDRINYILKRSSRKQIHVSYPSESDLSLATDADRAATIRAMLRIVKTHVGLDLERFLQELAAAAEVPWDDHLDRSLAEEALMTWDQVRELRDAGMDIQSHTRTHRVLQTLDATQLRDELRGSRDDLEREMNAPITAISYPVGHRLQEREDVRQALRDAGYKLGFTNATGTHRIKPDGDPYDVSRIGLDFGTPDSLFRAMLAAPALFG
ncbi:MAG: polysaccharide deacetylase family protein [Deltaproteobacteria bacterium]|nr:polysaccharide deacetylase family protein [Deltaproteobacteria bacterium]